MPVHLFIHADYWQQLSKRESFFLAPDVVDAGSAFAAVDCTLAPEASVDEIVAEFARPSPPFTRPPITTT